MRNSPDNSSLHDALINNSLDRLNLFTLNDLQECSASSATWFSREIDLVAAEDARDVARSHLACDHLVRFVLGYLRTIDTYGSIATTEQIILMLYC